MIQCSSKTVAVRTFILAHVVFLWSQRIRPPFFEAENWSVDSGERGRSGERPVTTTTLHGHGEFRRGGGGGLSLVAGRIRDAIIIISAPPHANGFHVYDPLCAQLTMEPWPVANSVRDVADLKNALPARPKKTHPPPFAEMCVLIQAHCRASRVAARVCLYTNTSFL